MWWGIAIIPFLCWSDCQSLLPVWCQLCIWLNLTDLEKIGLADISSVTSSPWTVWHLRKIEVFLRNVLLHRDLSDSVTPEKDWIIFCWLCYCIGICVTVWHMRKIEVVFADRLTASQFVWQCDTWKKLKECLLSFFLHCNLSDSLTLKKDESSFGWPTYCIAICVTLWHLRNIAVVFADCLTALQFVGQCDT
jgi:hypothetical protein